PGALHNSIWQFRRHDASPVSTIIGLRTHCDVWTFTGGRTELVRAQLPGTVIEGRDENREQELEVGVVLIRGGTSLAILLCPGIGCCVRIFCDWICRSRISDCDPVHAAEGLGSGSGTFYE